MFEIWKKKKMNGPSIPLLEYIKYSNIATAPSSTNTIASDGHVSETNDVCFCCCVLAIVVAVASFLENNDWLIE